jgi:hypothetical protein
MSKRLILLIAAFSMVALGANSVQAQAPSAGYGAGLGWGFAGGYFQTLNQVSQQRIPYFALNPPVYYGEQVARPYGYSPFATPPALLPAELRAVPQADFKEISNPFYKESGEPKARSKPIRKVSLDKTT